MNFKFIILWGWVFSTSGVPHIFFENTLNKNSSVKLFKIFLDCDLAVKIKFKFKCLVFKIAGYKSRRFQKMSIIIRYLNSFKLLHTTNSF